MFRSCANVSIWKLIIDFLNFLVEASGRLSPVWNGAKKDVTTLGNKLAKDEGEIKMDMDVFRQV